MTASDTDLIRDSIVVETAVGWTPECLDEGPAMLERFHASGFSMLGLTIGADWDKTDPTMHHFARERARFEREPDRFELVESVDDIHAAKAAGKLGIAFHFQGAGPLGYDPRLIAPFYRLGIRWMILAYNVRNPLGDGCHEPSNAGLSMLGAAFVREMNRVGMIIDASHAGKRTSLDIIAASEKPVFFSHSNARALCDHERNIDDEQIRAVGERVAGNDASQVVGVANENQDLVAEGLRDLRLDPGRQRGRLGFGAVEDNVAALHVACHVLEPQRLVHGPQVFHFDLLVAADVDAAQHGDVGFHGLLPRFRGSTRSHLLP